MLYNNNDLSNGEPLFQQFSTTGFTAVFIASTLNISAETHTIRGAVALVIENYCTRAKLRVAYLQEIVSLTDAMLGVIR